MSNINVFFFTLLSIFVFSDIQAQNALSANVAAQMVDKKATSINVAGPILNTGELIFHKIKPEGDAIFFEVAEDKINQIIKSQPELVRMRLPLGNSGNDVTVIMYNKKPYTSDALVRSSDGNVKPMNESAFYRGIVEGDPNSVVAISFFEGEIGGMISTSQWGQFDIGKFRDGLHTIVSLNTLPAQNSFECGFKEGSKYDLETSEPMSFETRDQGDCVRVYIEADNDLYRNKNSNVSTTENYVNGFFNIVSTLYDNENITVVISEIFVWTTNDPYRQNSSENALDDFTDMVTNFNGDIAHLVALDPGALGGIAWLSVLCNNSIKHAYSDINASYQGYPNYSWTTMVVTHEIGHNIGSRHTHWCGWTGGALDNCYDTEGSCQPGPPPVNGGTIMSYCHLTSHGINLANGFGQQPGNRIRNRVNVANCLSPCAPGCPTFVLNGQVSHVTCFDGNNGEVNVTPPTQGTPPYTYQWSNGGNTNVITNLIAGTYSLTVTDSDNCTGTASFVVNQPTELVVTAEVNNVTCAGGQDGSIILNVSNGTPGYTYSWQHGANTESIHNIVAGTYSVTVTDANGCSKQATYQVTQPNQILLQGDITHPSCFGENDGSITVSVSGGTPGYFFNWNNGATGNVFPNAAPGTYTVTVTDIRGCAAIGSYTIVSPQALNTVIQTTDVTQSGGSDGSATAIVNGGTIPYSYLWSTNETTSSINGLSAGSYGLTVTDQNGCTDVQIFTINEPDCTLSADITGSEISCHGVHDGQATVTTSNNQGNVVYLWSNGGTTQTIFNLQANVYTVTITDDACTVIKSISLSDPSVIDINVVTTNASCNTSNGSITIQPFGGTPPYTYLWSNGSTQQNLTNLPAGDYFLTLTDDNGCNSYLPVTISEVDNQPPTFVNNQVTIYLDEDGQSSLTVIDPGYFFTDNCSLLSVTFSNADFDCSHLGQQSITATGRDFAGNQASILVTVTVLDTIAPEIICPNDISQGLCQGGEVFWDDPVYSDNCLVTQFSQTAGKTIGSFFELGTHLISYEAKDNAGNLAQCSFNIQITEGIQLQLTKKDMSCHAIPDGSAQVDVSNVSAPFTIKWSNGATTESITGLIAGTYSVTVTDANNCSFESSVIVINPEPLALDVTEIINASSIDGADGAITIEITGGTPGYTFEWFKNNTLVSIEQNPSNLSPGSYRVNVRDKNGCLIVGADIVVSYSLATGVWHRNLISIYPNPASHQVMISGDVDDLHGTRVVLMDSYGRLQMVPVLKQDQQISMDVSKLVDGFYFIHITRGSQSMVFKIVVSH